MEYEGWIVAEKPGYQGKRKDADLTRWNGQYGVGNHMLAWLTGTEIWDFNKVFWQDYVAGYTAFLYSHPEMSDELAINYSYTYDKDFVTKEQAFDPTFLVDTPGFPNQFHHVALNIAQEFFIGKPFRGLTPLQVREGKPGTDPTSWPLGWPFSPSQIPVANKLLIPKEGEVGWWKPGSVEDFYQRQKVLLVRA